MQYTYRVYVQKPYLAFCERTVVETAAPKPKIWTVRFITLASVNFCSALTFYLLMVKITEYALVTYNVSHSLAAASVSLYVIGALFARLFLGGQIDRWGAKRAMFIGLGLMAVCSLLYLISMGIYPLLAIRFVHGIGFGVGSGAVATAAALILPESRRGEGIGYFSMAQALATGIGPFVAILLSGNSFMPVFAVSAVLSIVAFLCVLLVKLDDIPGAAPKPKHAAATAGDAAASKAPAAVELHGIHRFVHTQTAILVSVLFLMYFGYAGIISFLVLFTDSIGLSGAMSFFFIVYAIAILVSRPPMGRLMDRRGENAIMYLSMACFAVGLALLAIMHSGAILLISAALCGFGLGVTQSTIQAVVARDAEPEHLGLANSTFFMSMDLGSGVAPVIIGAIIPFAGYRACYAGLAVLVLLALGLYHLVHGRKPEVKELLHGRK